MLSFLFFIMVCFRSCQVIDDAIPNVDGFLVGVDSFVEGWLLKTVWVLVEDWQCLLVHALDSCRTKQDRLVNVLEERWKGGGDIQNMHLLHQINLNIPINSQVPSIIVDIQQSGMKHRQK
jgi:hypothetical protein